MLTLHDRQKQQCMPSREYKAIRALSSRSLHLAKGETKSFLLGSEKAKNQVFALKKFFPAQLLVGVETNPGPPKYGRLSEEERWRVVHLTTEDHLSTREVNPRAKAKIEEGVGRYALERDTQICEDYASPAGRVCATTGRAHSLLVYIVMKIPE